jgi:amino-acid N-acetyltransferase
MGRDEGGDLLLLEEESDGIAAEVRIAPAAPEDLPFVIGLMKESGLPVEGVANHFGRYLVARRGEERIGCVGMEIYGENVLLRSLAVVRRFRNAGAGGALLGRAIAAARTGGARTAWGLTTFGNKGIFLRFGFRAVPRIQAPPALLRSSQFRGVCPESAVLITLSIVGK